VKTVLAIAGSDPTGGAGIQVDLQVFHTLEVHGLTAITAITAQNEHRFFSLNPVSSHLVREQLNSIVATHPLDQIDAVKIGMLGTEENVFAVYRFLEHAAKGGHPLKVVLDPVLKSSTGAILLEPKGIAILREFIIPLSTIVTPNLDEAETLAKMKVRTLDEMKEAALHLHTAHKGVKAVLVKGGHLKDEATDVLYDGRDWKFFPAKKRFSKSVHGTGCALSSAIAASIANGLSIEKSIETAKDYVTNFMRDRS
jgi:hydroxymethylpyrimidine/phosphomethylpyrimidine kinase